MHKCIDAEGQYFEKIIFGILILKAYEKTLVVPHLYSYIQTGIERALLKVKFE